MFIEGTSLKKNHTFGLDVYANQVIFATDIQQLMMAWQNANIQQQPVLLLGEGSNVVFLDNFSGTVIVNRLKGIGVTESENAWLLHVNAGENWHQFVKYTLEQGMPGLENLALIPGCVGSSPIQNIGAYGVELKNRCEYVDLLDLQTGNIQRIFATNCQFSYRDSIFKHQYLNGYAIVAVGFKLLKLWKPVLEYGDLKQLNKKTVTPYQVFETVCTMRNTKLPNPVIIGNAGSFFKNPIVSFEIAKEILLAQPSVPKYFQKNGMIKLAAGWLIDQCHLKGHTIGGAAVHRQQALILTNQSNATPKDVIELAKYVRQQVGQRFNIWLEPEVRFIGKWGEQNATEVLSC